MLFLWLTLSFLQHKSSFLVLQFFNVFFQVLWAASLCSCLNMCCSARTAACWSAWCSSAGVSVVSSVSFLLLSPFFPCLTRHCLLFRAVLTSFFFLLFLTNMLVLSGVFREQLFSCCHLQQDTDESLQFTQKITVIIYSYRCQWKVSWSL